MSWLTVSNAFFKSMNTTKLNNFRSMFKYQSFVQSSKADAVSETFGNQTDVLREGCLATNTHIVD
jgi:hypothetical protein